jgi:Ca-activated chloride channel homolog
MNRLIHFLLAVGLSTHAYSQIHTVTGIVRDAETQLPIPFVMVSVVPGDSVTQTDFEGKFRLTFPVSDSLQQLRFSALGYLDTKLSASSDVYELTMQPALMLMQSVEIISYSAPMSVKSHNSVMRLAGITSRQKPRREHTESYSRISENGFQLTRDQSVTTFSVDVDRASYSNIRRFISKGDTPPADAVRIEEMLNYFPYDLPEPASGHPIAVFTESGECPWNAQHRLMRVALQAKQADVTNTPKGNYVFLIDVSGSMADDNKLPLVISSMRYLLRQMRPTDRVAIVTYAGQSVVELPSTLVKEKERIESVLDRLESGGSTAGQSGIQLAYEEALTHFIEGGNNRVILCTDGDFNVGISSPGDLERFIEEKRNSGITLTCLGFGMGNLKDDRLETLADKGNGNYAYIDGMLEAQKVLGEEFYGTMYTVAKDVKVQLEFNP